MTVLVVMARAQLLQAMTCTRSHNMCWCCRRARHGPAEVTIDLRGKRIHIGVADVVKSTNLKAVARRHGAAVVDQRVDAVLLVVDNVGAPGQRTLWAAVLIGATVMSTSRLLAAGQDGAYLTYRAAVGIRRWIWMSDDVKARHPAIAQIVVAAAATGRSLWRMVPSRAEFLAKSTGSAALQYVMGIVSTREKKQAGYYVFTCLVSGHMCCAVLLGVTVRMCLHWS